MLRKQRLIYLEGRLVDLSRGARKWFTTQHTNSCSVRGQIRGTFFLNSTPVIICFRKEPAWPQNSETNGPKFKYRIFLSLYIKSEVFSSKTTIISQPFTPDIWVK